MAGRISDKRRRRQRDSFIRKLLRQPVSRSGGDSGRSRSGATARDLTDAGQQFHAGLFRDTEESCIRILTRDRDIPEALRLLALCCFRTGAQGPAEDLLRRAIEIAPDDGEAHAELGLVYGQQGKFDAAISCFRASLERRPDDLPTLHNLGYACVQTGAFDDAVGVFRKAIALSPDTGILHMNCGGALQQAGRLEEAEACYRRAIELEPDSADCQVNLGSLLGRMNRLDESLRAFERAVALSPEHRSAIRSIGDTCLKTGDHAEAARALNRVVQLAPDDLKARFDLTHALALSGRTAEAVAVGEAAIALAPPSAENLITLTIAYLCDRNHRAALETCDMILAGDPGHCAALAFKSTALNEMGCAAEAQYLLDADSLVRCFDLAPPDGYRDIGAFNRALCEHIRNHPTLYHSKTNRSLNNGQATLELLDGEKGPFADFEEMILGTIAQYQAVVDADPSHPFLQSPPQDHHLEVWANIMDSDGFHDTHFHPTGWLSGTYYPSLPPLDAGQARENAGCIEFGRSLYSIPTTRDPRTRVIQPREGLVVLFPSYFGHRTLPFDSPEKRYSIAFDVVPNT
ncbi:MAG: tetratricopeptide repeat protein [Alphaproteobacteria bacterium]